MKKFLVCLSFAFILSSCISTKKVAISYEDTYEAQTVYGHLGGGPSNGVVE